jgi:predicted RNA-binding protein YlqC (UPF0109 family)
MASASPTSAPETQGWGIQIHMKELVEFMARSLVDDPTSVRVDEEWHGDRVILRLEVAETDKGKVIGKQGRIANAMRTLLKVAATRDGARASLDID